MKLLDKLNEAGTKEYGYETNYKRYERVSKKYAERNFCYTDKIGNKIKLNDNSIVEVGNEDTFEVNGRFYIAE